LLKMLQPATDAPRHSSISRAVSTRDLPPDLADPCKRRIMSALKIPCRLRPNIHPNGPQ